jgi:hypothetical protein
MGWRRWKVINNTFKTAAAAGAGLKRSLGIRGECFLAIHTSIVLISRFDRTVIPFLLEAAAQFSDFGHSIIKINEKNELELALTNP